MRGSQLTAWLGVPAFVLAAWTAMGSVSHAQQPPALAAITDPAELRARPREVAKPKRDPAPVMVYFEKDRNSRLLGRIKETLEARGIAFTELDVTGDATTKNYVMREARCKEDDLPIVFVAAAPIGGSVPLASLAAALAGVSPVPFAGSSGEPVCGSFALRSSGRGRVVCGRAQDDM